MEEPFAGAPGDSRLVQYFDKSRMEINDPSTGEVTSGLLVLEMIEGRIQIGPESYEERGPADIVMVGDPRNDNPDAPTYRTFSNLSFPINPDPAPVRTNEVAIDVLLPDGTVTQDPAMGDYYIVYDFYDEELGHNTVQVFTNFFARHGMVYENGDYRFRPLIQDWRTFVGLPISEPYWVRVMIGGVQKDVLIQAFQRRVMTYTPSNPPDWEVEWGNVGRHYLRWRYGYIVGEPGEPLTPVGTAEPTAVITETATVTATATVPPVETETAAPVETETAITATATVTATETAPPAETETAAPVETETAPPAETETAAPVETETDTPQPTPTLRPLVPDGEI
jgi:hypothetical protein